MSSCSRTRPERRRLRPPALLVVVLALLPWAAPAAAAPAVLPVAAVLVHGDRTTLVVDLGASSRPGPRSATVTHDGVSRPADVAPVISDGLTVALVLDTSVAGAATLPAWQSAAARFVLEAPAATRSVVIADSAPATVVAGPQRGAAGTVRALASVPARGHRDTAGALALAMRQPPATAPGRRVVVLYTTGADAAGEEAGALAERLRLSGTILVVVGTAAAGAYWAPAAAATGGFFAPAGDPVVVPALDQVSTVLAGRHLVEFPTPPKLPARVSVRVDTGDLTLAGDALLPAPASPAQPARRPSPVRSAVLLGVALAVLALVIASTALPRRRGHRTPLPRPVARGRATVRPPVARGRAAVPGPARVAPPPRE